MPETPRAGADVIIVGGGIAGLSVAALLSAHCSVLLLEREPLLASQASGNNAAIHRPLEHDAFSAVLAARSRQLLDALIGPSVLDRTGLSLVSDDAEVVRSLAALAGEHTRHAVLEREALLLSAPALAGGQVACGLHLSDGGVLDLHALTSGLASLARARGAQLRTRCEVAAVAHAAGRVRAVVLRDGSELPTERVVLAGGAANPRLGAASGVPLPLTPLRRHLVQLRAASCVQARAPIVWRIEDEVYFRSESAGLLASPCDETAWSDEPPPTDPAALVELAQKFERTAPALASCEVRRSWACLRTFAPDRELVAGADPRVRGLHWLAGLGGRGMSTALAAAEVLVDEILGRPHVPAYAALSVARLCRS